MSLKGQVAILRFGFSILAYPLNKDFLSVERRKKGITPMVQAFLDESGKGHGPVLVFAGWASTAPKWARFTAGWKAALRAPPSISRFKMSEAASLHGEFFKFTEKMRNGKVKTLANLINEFVEYGICVSVRGDHYSSILEKSLSRSYDRPYVFAATHAIVAVVNAERMRLRRSKVDFVFDAMSKTEFLEILEFRRRSERGGPARARRRLGRIEMSTDDNTMPLQAADMLSWIMRNMFDQISRGEIEEFGFADNTLKLLTVRHEAHYFDAINLRPFMKRIRTEVSGGIAYENRAARSRRLSSARRANQITVIG